MSFSDEPLSPLAMSGRARVCSLEFSSGPDSRRLTQWSQRGQPDILGKLMAMNSLAIQFLLLVR